MCCNRKLIFLTLGGVLCLAAGSAAQTIDQSKANHIKAAYIYHMAQLTTWPKTAIDSDSTLSIVFVGETTHELASILADNTHDLPVQGKTINVTHLSGMPISTAVDSLLRTQLNGADIVFVGPDQANAFLVYCATAAVGPILIAGEGRTFPRQGGMVGFYVRDQRVHIEVNLLQVEQAGLHLSAEFLQHVAIVKPDGEG